MQLQEFAELVLEYEDDDPVVVAPFGSREAQGFGLGRGHASGGLTGDVRWADFPRRRSDGVFLPDIRGVIATAAGPVLWRLDGISLLPDERDRRRLVGSVRFLTEIPDQLWLNDCQVVHGGALDLTSYEIRLPLYVCRVEPDPGPA